MEIRITKDLLERLISLEASKTVGILMKRFEIIEDREILKKDIKELQYEAYRNMRDLIISCGLAKESIHLQNINSPRKDK